MSKVNRFFFSVFVIVCLAKYTVPASAQDLLEEYRAFISQDDIHNSSGGRLTAPWAIIRQDRANFHRFGIRDSADQPDRFFASEANRAVAERLLSRGSLDPAVASQIVSGNVMIRVQIYGRFGVGEFLRVYVHETTPSAPAGTSTIQSSGTFYFVNDTRPPDDWLALRTAPGRAGVQIAKLYNGTRLQVLYQQPDNWWRVRAVDMNLEGWVLTRSGSRVWVYCCR